LSQIPESRIRVCNDASVNADGDYVLYWMIAFRRTRWNHSLQRAAEWAEKLAKPLLVLEALRVGYPWASERLHRFIVEGMADNARQLRQRDVIHYAYVEDQPDAGKGLLQDLASRACLVITDDFPAFFLPRMVAAAARQLPVRLEAIDSNGLLPLRATDRVFETAYSFRRYIQKNLVPHLTDFPLRDPLADRRLAPPVDLPAHTTDRWPNAVSALLTDSVGLADLPIDHDVPVTEIVGGATQADTVLQRFLAERLPDYAEERNHPDTEAASGLSPYLHFGHISSFEIFDALMTGEDWDHDRLAGDASGKRSGWWGTSENAEAFLDQFITWRELGFNRCAHRDDYDRYDSLPGWARATLAEHTSDERRYLYSLSELEASQTHDEIWNAAQNQLRREGRLHNYLRMLWGKKILEWSPTPQDALEVMIELNNKYALDGRDPNSYSGIFWCLGRYDRPWGPERPIFGKIRYMSSANTARKLRLSEYLEKYSPSAGGEADA
jgi:deoxyribodipyrimidine photo-lyase